MCRTFNAMLNVHYPSMLCSSMLIANSINRDQFAYPMQSFPCQPRFFYHLSRMYLASSKIF